MRAPENQPKCPGQFLPPQRRKPDWLRQEVLRLKAHMPQAGCRSIATHQHAVTLLRRQIQSTKPRAVPVNAIWAMDLTFFTSSNKFTHAAIGIVDHGSRLALRLQVLAHRCSWTLLGHLCLAIAQHGKPRKLRTDNEAIFNSWVFNGFLKLAGIHHQTTQTHAPWQNGRIERLFGSLKPLLKQLVIPSGGALQTALGEFKAFYSHMRPHQNLHGLHRLNTLQDSGPQTCGKCASRRSQKSTRWPV